eukprot:g3347.t1
MSSANGTRGDVRRLGDIHVCPSKFFRDVSELIACRWRELTFEEISGSTGDLGTFLPLLLNMAAVETAEGLGSIVFSRALFWAGFMNVFTGLVWDSPMPIQPMKTIAAVAITDGLSRGEVIGAGLSVSAIVLILGLTNLVEKINYLTPISVVRGLQVGLGITMCVKGLDMVSDPTFGPTDGPNCILLGVACFAFTLFALTRTNKKIPSALVLVSVGFLTAMVKYILADDASYRSQWPVSIAVSDLSLDDIGRGFWLAGLAQLPLTCLNSVVSVCDLNNKTLFPNDTSKRISRASAAVSVGLINLVSIPFGAVPMCHGAGGLAAQYQFGARGGSSIVFLGIVKIVVAVVAGRTGSDLLEEYPGVILGVLLFFSGLGLAKAGATKVCTADSQEDSEIVIMLATTGATVALQTGWGCLIGLVFACFHGGFRHVLGDLKSDGRWAHLFSSDAEASATRTAVTPTKEEHGEKGEGGTDVASPTHVL